MTDLQMPTVKPGQSIIERTEQALKQAPFFVPEHNIDPVRFPHLAASMTAALVARAKAKPEPVQGLSEAKRLRLVKASKCPTRDLRDKFAHLRWTLEQRTNRLLDSQKSISIKDRNGDEKYRVGAINEQFPDAIPFAGQSVDLCALATTGHYKPFRSNTSKGPGRFTVITHRGWSDEYRIRTQVETTTGTLPPEQSGERSSDMLSMRGARSIGDSCHYMALKKGGYTTFLTLTLDAEARQRVASGETTVQKEISRFWDAAQKMYSRGWLNELTGNKVKGKNDSLHYCWVVENPTNDNGEDNPHAHILMRWRVPYREFEGWAKRLEQIWGQGFAHLEKIKEPEKAGAYMAKAAGYMTKAEGRTDQGTVRGNRYGISKPSRAPEWVQLERYELGIMGSLITDTFDFFSFHYGRDFNERKQLNSQLADTPKSDVKRRHSIGARLEKVRAKLNELPAVASKHQLMIKGREAFEQFWAWATDCTGRVRASWLPIKDAGEVWSTDVRPNSLWLDRFYRNLKRRRFERHTGGQGNWESMVAEYSEIDHTSEYEMNNWGYV